GKTSSRAPAAKSSRCCCPRSGWTAPSSRPRRCAPSCRARRSNMSTIRSAAPSASASRPSWPTKRGPNRSTSAPMRASTKRSKPAATGYPDNAFGLLAGSGRGRAFGYPEADALELVGRERRGEAGVRHLAAQDVVREDGAVVTEVGGPRKAMDVRDVDRGDDHGRGLHDAPVAGLSVAAGLSV